MRSQNTRLRREEEEEEEEEGPELALSHLK